VLINDSLILPEPEPAGLLIPATTNLTQLNVVPAVPLFGVYENNDPLQIS
jgi:hypothetical protein